MRFFPIVPMFTLQLLAEAPSGPDQKLSRLAEETFPYPGQHCTTPADWFPRGKEAFSKAKKENNPIFLSVGYSTFHWRHVMARQSFADPEIASVMNEHFIKIKLDREERPHVGQVYMTFVQASTGCG